jgi:hypothetical protein
VLQSVGLLGLGVMAIVVGVLMLWAGTPRGPVHKPLMKSTLREELYIFLVLILVMLGLGLLIQGAINLTA